MNQIVAYINEYDQEKIEAINGYCIAKKLKCKKAFIGQKDVNKLLTYIENHALNGLVVMNIEDLSCDILELQSYFNLIKEKKMWFVSINDNMNSNIGSYDMFFSGFRHAVSLEEKRRKNL